MDNKLLHMLVVDEDRQRYLAGLRRVLKPGSCVMFNELYREDAYCGPVQSLEQYLSIFKEDITTPEERTAYNEGKEVKVRIPRVPARPRDLPGYAREMEENGFRIVQFQVLQSYAGCRFYSEIQPRSICRY